MSVDNQAPKAPKAPEPSKIPEPPQPRPAKMTRAQKKLYSSLTAANGFSMEDALRMLLAKEAQGHKKD